MTLVTTIYYCTRKKKTENEIKKLMKTRYK